MLILGFLASGGCCWLPMFACSVTSVETLLSSLLCSGSFRLAVFDADETSAVDDFVATAALAPEVFPEERALLANKEAARRCIKSAKEVFLASSRAWAAAKSTLVFFFASVPVALLDPAGPA